MKIQSESIIKKCKHSLHIILSISELEEMLNITDQDKAECPYEGDSGCDDCKKGLDQETCEELYEEWLIEQACDG